jgi:OmpA-OmpF porin, OOP family
VAVPPNHWTPCRTPRRRTGAIPDKPGALARAAPWLLAAALLAEAAPAAAGPTAVGYAYPEVAVVAADGDRQTDDGVRGALAAGRRVDAAFDVEAEGFYERFGERGGAQYQFGGAAHLLYYLRRWPPFSPYALGGAGVMLVEDYFNQSPRVVGELGGGFVTRIRPGWPDLRVDLRYRQVRKVSEFNDRVFADLVFGVGLVFPIGAPRPARAAAPPVPVVAPPPVEVDADGDGVPDRRDACPDTPPGTPVNPGGCTADLDRDGVSDGIDRCPDTPPGAPVDATGCAPDADGDGVGDGADACPGTPAGKAVDAKGCPPPEVLRLEGVHFAYDSADLTAPAREALADVAAQLKARPGVRVEVAGHTDDRGAGRYNLDLSLRRAAAVRERLVTLGVPAEALTARGYGAANPVAAGDGDAARARNRRVELRITDTAAP